MRRKWIIASVAAAVVVAGTAVTAVATAQEHDPGSIALAEPTGDHPVGTTTFQLEDSRRDDPWVPAEKRRLMVSLWYPADSGTGEPSRYMTADESRLFLEQIGQDLPPDTLSEVGTNAIVDAEPETGSGELPLTVLSPGFSYPRATLTGLAEDLASRGTVVAVVGHNYEAPTTMPDGQTNECVACETDSMEKVVKTRVKDLSFVLDRLTGRKSPWKGSRLIDDDAIVMGGHSIGGASSYSTMLADERVDAGFNMDGTFFLPGTKKLDRPFMMLGATEHGEPGGDDTWDGTWTQLSGWKRWLSVDGTGHSSLTDLSWLGHEVGKPLQDLSGERCTEIARDYVSAFVDEHLRDEEAPILDGPTTDNPEVRFHSP